MGPGQSEGRGFRAQWRSWLPCVSEFLRELPSQPNAAVYHDVHVVGIFQVLAQKRRGYLEELLLRGVVERLAYGLISSVLFYETEVRVCFSLLVLAQLCNRPPSAGKQHRREHTVLANLRLVHRNVGPVGDRDRPPSEIPVGRIVHRAPLVRGLDPPKDTPALKVVRVFAWAIGAEPDVTPTISSLTAMFITSLARLVTPRSPAPIGQGRRRGDAHIVGYYVLVYADTIVSHRGAVGRGLRASGRGKVK